MRSYYLINSIRNRLLVDPSLEEMGVDPVILDMLEEIVGHSEAAQVSRETIELILRTAFFFHQNPDKIEYCGTS